MGKHDFIEVRLSGGYFKTSYLRDEKGRKLFVDVESARRAGIKNPEESDRVVRWNDGTAVGSIEMAVKGNRVMRIPKEEVALINGLAYHEFVDSPQKSVTSPKLIMTDATKQHQDKADRREKRKMVDTIYVNLKNAEIVDLAAMLGYQIDDANEKLFDLKDSNPDRFLSFFGEPYKQGNYYKAVLKEETQVGGVLKRAILNGIVNVKAGAIYFEDDMVGTDFDKAVRNMMDTTKGGKSGILALIKAKFD